VEFPPMTGYYHMESNIMDVIRELKDSHLPWYGGAFQGVIKW